MDAVGRKDARPNCVRASRSVQSSQWTRNPIPHNDLTLASKRPAIKRKQVREMHTDQLLTINEVAEQLQVTPRTIRRWAANGEFPAPITMGGRTQRWRRPTVEQWIVELGISQPKTPRRKASETATHTTT